MPLVVLALIVALAAVASIALLPISIVLRYRAGTARRPARRWLATVNATGFAISSGMFLVAAAVATPWVPGAFTHAAAGLGAGGALGLAGLAATRWEPTPRALYYTPNRWLVLAITLVVSARIAYGFWRGWQAWQAGMDEGWLAASGAAGSLAAGAVVLGYYLIYWIGVRRRIAGA